MGRKKYQFLRVTVLGCENLLPSGGSDKRKAFVHLEVDGFAANTQTVAGDLNPQFNETFSVVLDSVNTPSLFIDVVDPGHPKIPDNKEQNIGHKKIDLALMVMNLERDIQYPLQKRTFKDEVSGKIKLKIFFTEGVDYDPEDRVGFERVSGSGDKATDMERTFAEISKLVTLTGFLEAKNDLVNRSLGQTAKSLEYTVNALRQMNEVGGEEVMQKVDELEKRKADLQEQFWKYEEQEREQDRQIARNEKVILQLQMLAETNKRATRRHSVTANDLSIPPVLEGEEDDMPKMSVALEAIGFNPDETSDRASEDSDEEQFAHHDEPEEEAEGGEGEGQEEQVDEEAEKWMNRYEHEKDLKNEWKQKCQDLELLYQEMLLQKELAEDTAQQQRNLEEAEALRQRVTDMKLKLTVHRTQLDEARNKYKKEAKARKKLFNEIQDLKGNVRFFCRGRPALADETACVTFGDIVDDVMVGDQGPFEFDQTFPPSSDHGAVFNAIQPLLQSVIDGFSCCVFSYGSRGSGKTQTMFGSPEDHGIVQRAADELFNMVLDKGEDHAFEMAVSLMEIVGSTIRDLQGGSSVTVRQEKIGTGVRNVIDNLTESVVGSMAEVHSVLELAQRSSPDTHMIVTINMSTLDRLSKKHTKSTLHLVDLASSELAAGEDENALALRTFIDVLFALSRKERSPYANSALTHVVADAMGLNSKVFVICTVSPAEADKEKTLATVSIATQIRACVGQDAGGNEPAELRDEPTTQAAAPAAAKPAARAGARGAAAKAPAAKGKPAAAAARRTPARK